MKPRGAQAVMASRHEPPNSLEFFPTPPWATRALFEHVIGVDWHRNSVWEPACGEGHMAEVLGDYFGHVRATDVFDYGYGKDFDFIGPTPYVPRVDWIITNPPFKIALDFALRGLVQANLGVALLVRTQWMESVDRYKRLFRERPPWIFAPFVERVPMVKGCWDPEATTATSYAWFVWWNGPSALGATDNLIKWIPPGCRRRLTKKNDVERFSKRTPAPLLEKIT